MDEQEVEVRPDALKASLARPEGSVDGREAIAHLLTRRVLSRAAGVVGRRRPLPYSGYRLRDLGQLGDPGDEPAATAWTCPHQLSDREEPHREACGGCTAFTLC
jgi:hypothetical protein